MVKSTKRKKLSSMEQWAKDEIDNICKKNNPNFDIFSDEFDYTEYCYKSAFKAYQSICNDNHSGMSYGLTKNILIKLLNEIPLSPITDDDFSIMFGTMGQCEWVSEKQCKRRSSLFSREYADGTIKYHDLDRAYTFNIENPNTKCHSFICGIVDEMFPIEMPYIPEQKAYAIATKEFLVDKTHGDYDTIGVLYIIKPNGEKVEVNRYYTDGRNIGLGIDDFVEVSKDKYDELELRRVDKAENLIAGMLLWTLISNSHTEQENDLYTEKYDKFTDDAKNEIISKMRELVKENIVDTNMFEYNTFNVRQSLCTQDDYYKNELCKIDGLREISEYLRSVLERVKNS